MTNVSMTPASRPRRGVIGVLALLGAGALTVGLVLAAGEAGDPPRVAGAVELATFASCDDLAAWGEDATGAGADGSVVFDMAGEAVTAEAGDAGSGAPAAANGRVASDAETFSAAGEGEAPAPPQASSPPAPATTGPATTSAEPPGEDVPDASVPSDESVPTEEVPTEDDGSEAAREDDEAGAGDGAEPAEDETNVAVEGVDEIDLVDRLTADVVLVASATRLAVVDLVAAEVVESTSVPWDAQITYDAEAGVAWVVGHPDGGGVSVERYAVDTEGLEVEGAWSTAGSLVDARRVGAELHVVATDGFWAQPAFTDDARGTVPASSEVAPIPFPDGPVPCDEVLHPVGPSDPSATLLVTLPATGDVAPVRATEVVGSGSMVHVTTGAVYLATPQWDEGGSTTGIHRFDLATLEPTGSGRVEGSLLDDFSMSEHDGVLRVATTHDGGGFGVVGRPMPLPMPVEPGIAAEDVEGTVAPTTAAVEGEALNEIVVLDTDGALDEVGRTEPFGKPGETLHGIRFAGTTAYAVTFLQTDPFYVVDLSDPADPRVVGEVELPGFSSYLHPLGGGLVVGFGPGEDGRASAKLFDVSDLTRPAVVGDLVLGDESTVAYDHHAYLDLGDGRFAVPTTDYGLGEDLVADGGRGDAFAGGVASAVVVVDTAGGELVEVARHRAATAEPATRVLTVGDGWALLAGPEIVTLDAVGAPVARITL